MKVSTPTLGAAVALVLGALLAGCATAPAPKDYSAFRAESPRSILVVPALNNTLNVPAPDFFLSTISRPFAERGYYVFPAHMVKRLMEDDGLADAGLVHSADATRLNRLFGCDSVLYVTIQQWDSKYVVLATQTTVKFDYALKSCKTGALLWEDSQSMVYSPQASSSGNPLADLIAQAMVAALEKGAPNYMPLTVQANAQAAGTLGKGLPAGPYLPAQHGKDLVAFPSAAN
ncbi:MAG: GNA1162 family protein [Pseudomonadota bacterium]